MDILDLFDIIAKAIYDNSNDDFFDKETLVEKYKKMFLSEYIVEEDSMLNIFGRVDFFYNERITEVTKVKLKKDNYKFLIYDVTGHNGEWQIIEFKNLKDVEEYVLNPGGILNMFTTDMIVLENLKVKKYRIYEILSNGEEIEVFDFEECSSAYSPNLVVKWY